MRHGGIFLTQQVYAEKDALNIKRIFGRGQGLGRDFETNPVKRYVKELQATDFEILKKDTYNATVYYADMADLIFILRNSPEVPDFDIDNDQRYLEEIEKKYKTKNGIKTNSARYLIISKKSCARKF